MAHIPAFLSPAARRTPHSSQRPHCCVCMCVPRRRLSAYSFERRPGVFYLPRCVGTRDRRLNVPSEGRHKQLPTSEVALGGRIAKFTATPGFEPGPSACKADVLTTAPVCMHREESTTWGQGICRRLCSLASNSALCSQRTCLEILFLWSDEKAQ